MKEWTCRQAPFKRERTRRGTFCSDNLQGSKESVPQAVTQEQETLHESDSDSNYSS